MSPISPPKAKLLADNRIRWEPGLNDPSFGGWAVTAGYPVAAWLALGAARRAPERSFERRFWGLAGTVLLALGVNKQLDLHILLIDWGRALAVESGWYQQRRLLQQVFMAAALLTGLAAAAWAWRVTRRRDPSIRLALGGLILTAAYALARASVFNHTGSILRSEVAGARWDWLVELAGVAIVALAAWRYRPRS